jgi:uncharacterized protein
MWIPAVACLLLFTTLSTQAKNNSLPVGSQQLQDQNRLIPIKSIQSEQSKIDPAKEADIRQLLAVMGGSDYVNQIMEQMEVNMRPILNNAMPPGDYREKLIDLFIAKFQSKFDANKFLEMIIPIYDKYLTDEEIKNLIVFYATPLGKKTLTALPKMMSEAQAAGSKMGEELGRQAMIEVLAEHPELKKALEEAGKPKQNP